MKKFSPAFVLSLSFIVLFFSCKKINEPTTLGGGLIPPIDNVNTFDTTLEITTKNILLNDSTKLFYQDLVALGAVNDPEFGRTETDLYFNIGSTVYGTYPFIVSRDSANDPTKLIIDSVVLSLAYQGAYGDINSFQTVRVYEISQTSKFSEDSIYAFTVEDPQDFITNTTELGAKSFFIRDLDDSIPFIRKGDTTKTVNTLRIKFSQSQAEIIGRRFANFDTSAGFKNDSIFQTFFRGLAVKADQAVDNGGLPYFTLASTNTRLTVYFQAKKNGVDTAAAVDFIHRSNGQANIIRRTPANGYASYLTNGASDKVYLQSAPGSYVSMKIPALDTFPNKVIHRAEIIATPIDLTAIDNIFYPPSGLMIDKMNQTGDSAFLLFNDQSPNLNGSINFDVFGGSYKNGGYNFNISRHVQGIITRREPNDTLRMYAPLRTTLFVNRNSATKITVPVINRIAEGRVVLGGGNHPDPAKRLRLRIIYSNL